MDFLDPKKERAHAIRIMIGYVLIGIALILTTIILLYQAYGFGVDKNGKVIQNGLVFVSSTPNPAQITINGARYKDDTNARLLLNSGQYTIELHRDGYRNWKRAVTVEGGSVERFDYPFLFPAKLQASNLKTYEKLPSLVTESLDRHWLISQSTADTGEFEIYDLSKPKEVAKSVKTITLPDAAFTKTQAGSTQTWEMVQWANDNRHVVLKHTFQKEGQPAYEYVLLDREDVTKSINLTTTWGVNPTALELRDRNYDKYYLYDETAQTVTTASIKEPTPKAYLSGVLASKSYGDDVMLYVSAQDAPSGKVTVLLREGDKTHTIRTLPAGSKYLVNLTKYSGDWYVAAGAANEGKVYVYENPVQMQADQKISVPVRVLKVAAVNYIEFSNNARFIMAENGKDIAVYDAENNKGYTYTLKSPLDTPQAHATWMDGHRIILTSNGKTTVVDFDGANPQSLISANSNYVPLFDRDYTYLYSIGGTPGQYFLQKTPLRTANDL